MSQSPQELIPARALNEWVYCNRLGVLEWVQAEFQDNFFTKDGTFTHRRQDRPTRAMPQADEVDDEADFKARSVYLDAPIAGLVARMDLVEADAGEVIPVDTKRGKLPPEERLPSQIWPADRIQLGAQAVVLREHGYTVNRAYVYYAGSKRRVELPITDELIAEVYSEAAVFRAAAESGELPAPLVDSPKCQGCSLAPICLPDETNLLRKLSQAEGDHVDTELDAEPAESEPRRLYARRDDRKPIYVTESAQRVGCSKGMFTIKQGTKLLGEIPVRDTSQISIFGRSQVSTMALRAAMDANVPVMYFTFGGYFIGYAQGHAHKNVVLRQAQYAAAQDAAASLAIARAIVTSKLRNQRTLLRRNSEPADKRRLTEMQLLIDKVASADSAESLLGLEGAGAKLYFGAFNSMLRPKGDDKLTFNFSTRNRRPPRDPINALLSYLYSLLTRECLAALLAAGYDPYLGFYHRPRYGKPALALDLMEEFRPLIADSVLLRLVNQGELTAKSFITRSDGCNLTTSGKRDVLRSYERRLREDITHPIFGYKVSWRRALEVQARLLSRHLLGELPGYQPIETR